jgi:hypothetical protein
MEFVENDKEIIGTLAFRDIKSKPGSANLYFGADLFSKLGIPVDSVLSFRFDKEKKEFCIKQFKY